jgi:hypothetical protein
VTSEYWRKLEAMVEMPLDADVFRVPPEYSVPQAAAGRCRAPISVRLSSHFSSSWESYLLSRVVVNEKIESFSLRYHERKSGYTARFRSTLVVAACAAGVPPVHAEERRHCRCFGPATYYGEYPK